jgi:hypothetical protein
MALPGRGSARFSRQHIVSVCGDRAAFDALIAADETNRQKLSTLKIRVKRRLSIWWHRPAVSFWM